MNSKITHDTLVLDLIQVYMPALAVTPDDAKEARKNLEAHYLEHAPELFARFPDAVKRWEFVSMYHTAMQELAVDEFNSLLESYIADERSIDEHDVMPLVRLMKKCSKGAWVANRIAEVIKQEL